MRLYLGILLCILFATLIIVGEGQATEQVLIKYFYFDGSAVCPDCPVLGIHEIIISIKEDYGDNVSILWLNVYSDYGRDLWLQYNFTQIPAVLIEYGHNEHRIEGEETTENKLREIINLYVEPQKPGEKYYEPLSRYVMSAFSLGLFSTFSPCLMAMLAFILTYTAGMSINLESGVVSALSFGLGFVAAILLAGSLVIAAGTSTLFSAISHGMTWISAMIAILVGLNLVGLLRIPMSNKLFVRKMVGKYVSSFIGLFLLGILFFLVRVPCAFPRFSFLLSSSVLLGGTLENILLLFVFSLGVLAPFLGVGLIGGVAQKLMKKTGEWYPLKFRIVSGAILVIYGIWLLSCVLI